MRLTTRTNLAMRTLMYCAVHRGQTVRTAEVAQACHASENHLGQVINQLGQAGFIETVRGRGGGIKLAKAPDQVTLGQVFRVFEAGVPFAECFKGSADCQCPLVPYCRFRDALSGALEAFYAALDEITVESLVAGNDGLYELFGEPVEA